MSTADKLAAYIVMTIWGLNFLVIKLGVTDTPPLLLGALRFAFVAFPAILFVKRPEVPLRSLVAYALTISFGQFAFLFSAINAGMPAGLASVVLQVQAFISPIIAAVVFGERLQRQTIAGLSIAFAGLLILTLASKGNSSVTLIGFVLTICAATSWAVGNILSKQLRDPNFMGLVVWSALIPIAPFLAMSALIDGFEKMHVALAHVSMTSIGVVGYLSYAASIVGYGIWTRLISRYPVQLVAPLTLLIPIIGIIAAWIVLGEALSPAQAFGCAVIITGLLVNMFGARLWTPKAAPKP